MYFRAQSLSQTLFRSQPMELLPTRLNPNPLKTTVVEIRIGTSLTKEKMLAAFFEVFSSILPKIETTNIPEESRRDPGLAYVSDYIFSNNSFKLGFGPRSISFEINGEYPLWPAYFSFIKETYSKINDLNIINSIERIGLRYGSLLNLNESSVGVVNLNFDLLPSDTFGSVLFNTYTATLLRENCSIFVQFINDAQFILNNAPSSQIPEKGFYIDIDAYKTFSDQGTTSYSDVIDIIEKLHSEEKKLFFSLLTDEVKHKYIA